MKKIAAFLLAALGLIASILLTQLHYGLAEKGFDEKSFCNVSQFIDCDTVVASRFSSVKTPWMTIPNSELGIIYYSLLLLALIYAAFAPEKNRRGTLAFFFVSVILANVYSLLMAYLSFSVLGVVCLMCLTTYVTNFLLLLLFPSLMGVGWRGIGREMGDFFAAISGDKSRIDPRLPFHLGIVLAAVIAGLVFFRGMNPVIHKPHVELPREAYLQKFKSLPVADIDVSGRPVWGNPAGKIKIVEFSDFQCPFCRKAAFTIKPYLKGLPPEVRREVGFYFFNYPLSGDCNPAIPKGQGHPFACLAAKSALCAGAQGKFWEFHDLLFQNQEHLSRPFILSLVSQAGLDQSRFDVCLESPDTDSLLKQDVDAGSKVTIEGTPTLFINGRRFMEWPDAERLRMVIEGEM